MKITVNLQLPSDRQLSWWKRDYWQVIRLYRDQNPESFLPDLMVMGFVLLALLGIALVTLGMAHRKSS
jgi:hypothetical protein